MKNIQKIIINNYEENEGAYYEEINSAIAQPQLVGVNILKVDNICKLATLELFWVIFKMSRIKKGRITHWESLETNN